MSQECVVALFSNLSRALIAKKVLDAAGFGDDNVSLITHSESEELKSLQSNGQEILDQNRESQVTKDQPDYAPAGRTGTGALMGSIVSVPIAVGTLLFPLFIAGPIVGAGVGALLGAFGDAQKNPVDDQPNLEEQIRGGAALIIVTAEDYRVRDAKGLLQTCDPIRLERHFLMHEG